MAAVLHVLREGADLVERRGEGDKPVARDAPVGGLEADDTAQRRRLADGAARVGARRGDALVGGQGRGGAAARAPGNALQVPGIAGDAEIRRLRGGAHGELVHVRLADEDGALVAQLLHHRAVIGRHEVVEDPRAAGRAVPLRALDVLERDGDAGKRLDVSLADLAVGLLRLLEGVFLHHRGEGVNPVLNGIDALEDVRHDLGGGDFLLFDLILQLVDGQFIQSHYLTPNFSLFTWSLPATLVPYSMTFGTR